jgi:thiol-disulfide isomerase/thioredoxin
MLFRKIFPLINYFLTHKISGVGSLLANIICCYNKMNKVLLFAFIAVVVFATLWITVKFVSVKKTKETFAEGDTSKPKVVLVHASWCKYCVEYLSSKSSNGKNTFDAAADQLNGKVDFEKLDYDEKKELANKYGVSSFPAIVGVERNGTVKPFNGDRDDIPALVAFAKSLS